MRIEASSINGKPHLEFNGGKILTAPKFHNIYIGNFWTKGAGKKIQTNNDTFTKDIIVSPYTSIWAEYGAGKGTFVGSSVVAAPRLKQISDSELQHLLIEEIKARRVPKPDGQTVYTLYLPPGTTLFAPDGTSSRDGLGGYHQSVDIKGLPRAYYAAIAFSDEKNGINFTPSATDNLSIVSSHEWSEAVTDPDVNNGKLGWYDFRYGEIGDIPINIGMPLQTVYERLNGYAVQKEWSNRDKRAEIIETEK